MAKKTDTPKIRCAVYTRKSTEEGLDQDFNTLDAQREACEAYIASQKGLGWVCQPDRFDDGGFSGGNLDRPALKRLINQIQAGHIDCIVVYKVDRLSRSLLDFSRLVEVFDAHKTAFVSVTQPINTADSAGRLMLNFLLSFAQFEREMISDRTRDKMCAARRKGKWTGGIPVLGYDIHPDGGKLLVNEDEAPLVREMFRLYLQHQSISKVCAILQERDILTKSWTTHKGRLHPGGPFSNSTLNRHLSNVAYTGQVSHQGQVYPGEHQAIIPKRTFEKARAILSGNHRSNGSKTKNRFRALLKGVARCAACDAAYVHSTTRKGPRVYRYYVCSSAQKKGFKTCPKPSIPSRLLESIVVDQIKKIGQDSKVQDRVLVEARRHQNDQLATITAQLSLQKRTLADLDSQKRGLLRAIGEGQGKVSDLEQLEKKLVVIATKIAELETDEHRLRDAQIDAADLSEVLELFDPIWDVLYPLEQSRIIELLIERVDYDGSTLGIEFSPTGIQLLSNELNTQAITS